jgi:CHASE1-domain containing sensor protein
VTNHILPLGLFLKYIFLVLNAWMLVLAIQKNQIRIEYAQTGRKECDRLDLKIRKAGKMLAIPYQPSRRQ